MSAYREIKTEYRNPQSLIAAMQQAEIEFKAAPDLKNPTLSLFGYHGDIRKETASIVIERKWVNKHWSGGMSNDIGFAWNGTEMVAIVSDYDGYQGGVVKGMDALKQRYAVTELRRQARLRGYSVTEAQQPDGSIQLQLVRR